MPKPELAHRWKHLRSIAKELSTQLPNVKIGPLIGSNCPEALEPIDVLGSEDGCPFAIRMFAGWVIVGPLYMCGTKHLNVSCRSVTATKVGSGRHLDHHLIVENRVEDIVTPQVFNKIRL